MNTILEGLTRFIWSSELYTATNVRIDALNPPITGLLTVTSLRECIGVVLFTAPALVRSWLNASYHPC